VPQFECAIDSEGRRAGAHSDHFYFFRILHILDVLIGMNGGQERRDVSLSGGGAATAL
jgi:hypothetical protein